QTVIFSGQAGGGGRGGGGGGGGALNLGGGALNLGAIGATGPRRVLTDSQGQFAFRDLAKATYTFSVTLPGYTGGAYGQKRPNGASRSLDLDEGEKVGDVTLRVWKFGSISGMLVDEAGEPAVGVQVRALRQSIVSGRPHWTIASSTATDDRGVYRIGSLAAADYVISVPTTITTYPSSTTDTLAAGSPIMITNGASN